MTTLDKVKEMQQAGLSEGEIIQKLRESGISDTEISYAVDQSKIKAAIDEPPQNQEEQFPFQQETPEYYDTPITGGMQPSVMEQVPSPGQYTQQPEEQEQYTYPTQQTYAPEYQPYQESSAEIITEIADQIAEEKLMKIKKDIGNISLLKINMERKIKDMDDRLKRIELIIDKLHSTILGRVGDYGENIEDIKKEMSLMQESFSKALPGFGKKESKARAKKGSAIDHYLRR